jgi:hypothetical protein
MTPSEAGFFPAFFSPVPSRPRRRPVPLSRFVAAPPHRGLPTRTFHHVFKVLQCNPSPAQVRPARRASCPVRALQTMGKCIQNPNKSALTLPLGGESLHNLGPMPVLCAVSFVNRSPMLECGTAGNRPSVVQGVAGRLNARAALLAVGMYTSACMCRRVYRAQLKT